MGLITAGSVAVSCNDLGTTAGGEAGTISRHFSPRLDALRGLPEGRGLTGCAKTPPSCHSERSEESRSEYFQRSARFLVVRQ